MFDFLRRKSAEQATEDALPVGTVAALTVDELLDRIDNAYTMAGVVHLVNSTTALRQSTVWACVRILAEIIAQLPVYVQVRQGQVWVEAEMHDALDLLAEPNDFTTQHELVSMLVLWSEMIGNGYQYKVRDPKTGKVRKLLPVEGNGVSVKMDANWQLKYKVTPHDMGGIRGDFGAQEIFHLRNFGSNGYTGLSTIGNHKQGIGLAMQLETHATKAYENGLQTDKYITMEKPLLGEALEAFKKQVAEYKGAVNAGKMPIFSNGAKIESIARLSLTDAQYVESRRMQKQEIAAIFGIPLFLLNDTEKSTTWGTGLEQLSRAFVRFSLQPRLNRLAQTFGRELILPSQRWKTRFRFDTDEFTLGSFKERMDGYKSGIDSGVVNPDECREMEGRNPRADGKGGEYRIPMNTKTQEQADEQHQADVQESAN